MGKSHLIPGACIMRTILHEGQSQTVRYVDRATGKTLLAIRYSRDEAANFRRKVPRWVVDQHLPEEIGVEREVRHEQHLR